MARQTISHLHEELKVRMSNASMVIEAGKVESLRAIGNRVTSLPSIPELACCLTFPDFLDFPPLKLTLNLRAQATH